MSRLTGTIELVDGTEIEIPTNIKTKNAALKYVRKIKKRGLWIAREGKGRALPFFSQEYIFPNDIGKISLKYEPVIIPEPPERQRV